MSAEAGSKLTLVREPVLTVGGEEVLAALRTSLAWLQTNQEDINDLNVFPVPDGDTGSNMYLTMRSAVEEAQEAADPGSAASVLAAAARGSLMGARGNSGVILSQVLRGLAQGVEGRVRIDGADWARGLDEARAVAYKAVMKPTEGTILTVIRAAADGATRSADEGGDVITVLESAVRASHAAVEKTTGQLQVLREAGVVDAGGFGLAVILEGITRAIADPSEVAPVGPRRRSGEDRVQLPFQARPAAQPAVVRRGAAAVAMKEEGWGYCTEFLVHGPGLDPASLRDELGRLGESALVVGDPDLVRVHIHTAEPAPLIALAASRGRLSRLKVEDMSAQHHDVLDRAEAEEATGHSEAQAGSDQSPRKPVGVVSVAPGSGFRDILTSLGADVVVEGGQTMNPSIEDLLNAVRSANADTVVLLPNNGNVILTAEQVDGLAEDVDVVVVPTRNLPQGISALLALEPDSPPAANRTRMAAAIEHVHAIEVTRAVRDSSANGHDIKAGDVLGIYDDEIREVGSDECSVIEAILRGVTETPELVTVYRGGDVTPEDADRLAGSLREKFATTEFELHDGGQEHYSYVLSLE